MSAVKDDFLNIINIKNDEFSIVLLPGNVIQILPSLVKNKETGAGGSNTNKHGKLFEDKTNNEPRLLSDGFTKKML